MKSALVCDALKVALRGRDYPKDVILHSDRGSQYCSKTYQRQMTNHQLKCGMSGKGNCHESLPRDTQSATRLDICGWC